MKKIVTVGGGTGSFTVLSGIKHIPDVEITAIVSMADDGGSTGVLRDELGVLPPGDVRQCLVALSDHSDTVRKLMNYRFSEGSLSGHNFGNIFLAALEKVSGDFVSGVEVASEILKVHGRVVPVTDNKADIIVTLVDGTQLLGEDVINHADIQSVGFSSLTYKDTVKLNNHAKDALLNADIIIIGPGTYHCSILPSILVDGFKEAVMKTKAKIVLPVNLTNKHGHTINWKANEYISTIENYIGRKVDHVLINNEAPSDEQIAYYKLTEGDGVMVTDDYAGDNAIRTGLLSQVLIVPTAGDTIASVRSFIRHDSTKLAEVIQKLL